MNRQALVVGINRYPFIKNLERPASDAEAIAHLLETYGGFKVSRLPTGIIDHRLVTQMVVDVKDSAGSLPLLQFSLTALWQQWHQQWRQGKPELPNMLTLNSYNELGGLKGTLEEQANKVFENLSTAQKEIAKWIFIELTQLGEDAEDTRRQVTKYQLVETLGRGEYSEVLVEEVIEILNDEKARLIVTSDENGVPVVDIAHEALIRHWDKLRDWVNVEREAIKVKRDIEKAAKEWESNGKTEDLAFLLQGSKLDAAEIFARSISLANLEREFLRVSRIQSQSELLEKILYLCQIDLHPVFSEESLVAKIIQNFKIFYPFLFNKPYPYPLESFNESIPIIGDRKKLLRKALVIGINRYPFLTHLNSSAPDADYIAQFLEQFGFQVERLPFMNDRLTQLELEVAILELFEPRANLIPDTALLFFSGYRLTRINSRSQNYLAASDSNPKKGLWGLSINKLLDILRKSPVRQKCLWIDASFYVGDK